MPSETFWNRDGVRPMTAPLEVTGELGNLCAARQAELEVVRKKKSDREAEIKRLIAVNAELVEALGQLYASSERMDGIAQEYWTLTLCKAREALIRAEGS